jgi:hypothetical protein
VFKKKVVRAVVGALGVAIAAAVASGVGTGLAPAAVRRAAESTAGPMTQALQRGTPFRGDVRRLPQTPSSKRERPEREAPFTTESPSGKPAAVGSGLPAGPLVPAPSPTSSFDGLDYATWGDGHPPDTNGDVGPNHYIQTVNTAIGIFRKSDGVRLAAFRFDTFMSQGHFGNLCDTDNYGDPVVLYDTFHDRWVITDFAFQLDAAGNVVNPPGSYQCFAVSQSGDPVSGGWNFYSLHVTDALQDYPKLGIWPDGLYMSANMFGFGANGGFKNVRVWALNLAQMEAGGAAQSVSFNAAKSIQGVSVFTLLPSNARVQAGTPPTGRPNYFASVWGWTNRVRIWKFHVDWSNTANSTFTGPTDTTVPTTWASPPSTVPEKSGNALDTLGIRLMMQNQYTNIGGVESLWHTHTVRGSSSSQSAVRWYQASVTGGTIAANVTQGATWNPDSKNRFVPSLAVDRAGNMAIGYSVSDALMFPAIRYAGRLATDPANTLSQTETSLIEGTGAQVGNCGGSACTRWGDYSAMTLDPDGCTFWYTTEYYATSGLDDHTRIGSFRLPQCTPLQTAAATTLTVAAATGTYGGTTNLQATLTAGGNGVSGKSVAFTLNGTAVGSATTNASGVASMSNVALDGIDAGTYSTGAAASFAGDSQYVSSSGTNSLTVAKANQTISFDALGDKTYGDPDFTVNASASSDLTVSFGATGDCTVTGSTVHVAGAGSCTITASQGGDGNYNAAPDVPRAFAIAKADQTIAFAALGDKTYGDPDFAVNATASSGLDATFAADGDCTIAGDTVHITGADSCTITASQGGDANYNPATDVPQTFTIAKASATLAFDATTLHQTYDGSPKTVTVNTTPSGLEGVSVTYSGSSSPPTGPGTYIVDAFMDDPNYAADPITDTFVIDAATTVKHVVADFNGDGTTDVSIFRPSTGRWFIRNQYETSYGSSSDIPVPGDYNGDGTTDIAIFRPSTGRWFIRNQYEATYGSSSEIPVPGDYNGDGSTDIAIFRPSTGRWFIRNQYEATYGSSTDIPVPGDYNGDGTTDIAIFRPSTGRWFIRNQYETGYGSSTDTPVPGDYNGDGTIDIAIFRPSTGRWYIRNQYETTYGNSTDVALPLPYAIRKAYFSGGTTASKTDFQPGDSGR